MATSTVEVSDALLDAIAKVESGNNENAVNGGYIGAHQINREYYQDAVAQDPTLKNGNRTFESCKGPGSAAYSKKVIRAYMNRYATLERLGSKPYNQDFARIHKGGPNGWDSKDTLSYWAKVKSAGAPTP